MSLQLKGEVTHFPCWSATFPAFAYKTEAWKESLKRVFLTRRWRLAVEIPEWELPQDDAHTCSFQQWFPGDPPTRRDARLFQVPGLAPVPQDGQEPRCQEILGSPLALGVQGQRLDLLLARGPQGAGLVLPQRPRVWGGGVPRPLRAEDLDGRPETGPAGPRHHDQGPGNPWEPGRTQESFSPRGTLGGRADHQGDGRLLQVGFFVFSSMFFSPFLGGRTGRITGRDAGIGRDINRWLDRLIDRWDSKSTSKINGRIYR